MDVLLVWSSAVLVVDFDATNVRAIELRFIGDRADDIAGFDPVRIADGQTEAFAAFFGRWGRGRSTSGWECSRLWGY